MEKTATDKLRQSYNSVTISGVLKENNLERGTDKEGNDIIKGDVVIGWGEDCEQKVNFYTKQMTATGTVSKLYNMVEQALDYVSLAKLLKGEAEDGATAMKVTIRANFSVEDYLNKKTGDVSTSVKVKGISIASQKETDADGAEFKIEGVVTKIKRVVDKNTEEETDRVAIEMLMVEYDGSVKPITVYAEGEAGEFIESQYEVNKTTQLSGIIGVKLEARIVEERGFKGTTEKTVYDAVSFRMVTDGEPEQFEDSEDTKLQARAYDMNLIKKALAERQIKLDTIRNGGGAEQKSSGFSGKKAPAKEMPASAKKGW